MNKTAWLLAPLVVLSACNPDLKAEKQAWNRYAEQYVVVMHKQTECADEVGLETTRAEQDAAAEECKPFKEALEAVPMRDTERWRAAYRVERASPACQEESRLRLLWLERYKTAESCAADAQRENEIRRAEFHAACEKCALKQRCEENERQNIILHVLRMPPSDLPKNWVTDREKAEATVKGKTLAFGCDK